MLLSIFLGWFVSQDLTKRETGIENKVHFKSWLFMVRFVAPIFLFVILFMAFAE
jgi:SNF family Na+-dependent transporter